MDNSTENDAIEKGSPQVADDDAEKLVDLDNDFSPSLHKPEEEPEKSEKEPEKCDVSTGRGIRLFSIEKEVPHGWRRYLGVIYVMCAINMSSIGSIILKLLGHIHPVTVCLYASPVGFFLSIPFIAYRHFVQEEPVLKNVLPMRQHKKVIFLMWVRATCSVCFTFFLIWSIQFILVSESRTIFSANLIIVNILGRIFFKEKLGIVTCIVSVIALCGIAVMSKPPFLTGKSSFDVNTLKGIGLALCCMLLSSVNMLILRFLSNVYHGVLNASVFIYTFFVILPFAIGFRKMVIPECTTWDILGIILFGVLTALTNTFLTLALQNEKVGVVALIRTCELILTFIWQMILLKKFPDWISYLGAAMILIGVFAVGLRKWVEGTDQNSLVRKRLKWLLL